MSAIQQKQYAYKQLTKINIHFIDILRSIHCKQEFFKLNDGQKLSTLLDNLFLECGQPPFQKPA